MLISHLYNDFYKWFGNEMNEAELVVIATTWPLFMFVNIFSHRGKIVMGLHASFVSSYTRVLEDI